MKKDFLLLFSLFFLFHNPVFSGPKEVDLFQAVESGNLLRVEEMITAGAQVNSTNLQDETPLMVAVRKGFEKIAFTLVKAGATEPECDYNEAVIRRKLQDRIFSCVAQRKKLLDAIELFQQEASWDNRLKTMTTLDLHQSRLMPYLHDQKFPRCPDNGQYIYDPAGETIFCTVHGELPKATW
ncbi:MAG: hypothetical protein PHQ23_02750 [Candidatus Wallbacteria bacterium]|nr:hypothetical protein [Candidatus Wallbacteria bacterium]